MNKIPSPLERFNILLALLTSMLVLPFIAIQAASAAPTATHTVCGVGCSYTTIQAAHDAAAPGDTIAITGSRHNEVEIVLSKDLLIVGDGSASTTIGRSAAVSGGRIFTIDNGATVTIKGVTIRDGQGRSGGSITIATRSGGAIHNQGHLTLLDVAVLESTAGIGEDCFSNGCQADSAGHGGGIYNHSNAKLILINATVANNRTGDGANCEAFGCAAGVGGDGAGIYNRGDLLVFGSSIYGNEVGESGLCEGVPCNGIVTGSGGGIYNAILDDSRVYMSNSTLSHNTSDDAAFVSWKWARLFNVTIADNSANGIIIAGDTIIRNSIIADNGMDDCVINPPLVAQDGNLDSDGTCSGFSLQNASANLLPLGPYGELTQHRPPDWDSDALSAGSRCERTDQRGTRRPLVDNICDLGAIEKVRKQNCSNVNTALPDAANGSVQDQITFTETGTIKDVSVFVGILHTYIGDLSATLAHRDGISSVLLNRPGVPASAFGCSLDDVFARFMDGATQAAENSCGAPPSTLALFGDYQPTDPLAVYGNEAVNATWTIDVMDNQFQEFGTFDSWCVDVEYVPDVSAETTPQVSVSASQTHIGPGDSFYYRVDITTGSNGWVPTDNFLFTAQPASVQTVTLGTAIVPPSSGISCPTNGVGFVCTGGMLAPNSMHTFYFPVTNPATNGCTFGWVYGTYFADGQQVLDEVEVPACVATSQGSTLIPTQPIPTAVAMADSEISADATTILLVLLTTTLIMITIGKSQPLSR